MVGQPGVFAVCGPTPKGMTRNFDWNPGKVDNTWHPVVSYSFTLKSAFMQYSDTILFE